MSEARIQKCDFSVLSFMAYPAKKEGVGVPRKESPREVWFGVFEDGRPIGMGALLQMNLGRSRIKGIYVQPKHRGVGHGEYLVRHLIHYAADGLHCSYIEAFAYNPEFYEKLGFNRHNMRPNGAVKVSKTL